MKVYKNATDGRTYVATPATRGQISIPCKPGANVAQVKAALVGLLLPSGTPNAGRQRVALIAVRLAKAGLLARNLASNIRTARQIAGISQAEAAADLAVEQATYSKWERGLHEPDLPTLRRIAQALSTTAAALLVED